MPVASDQMLEVATPELLDEQIIWQLGSHMRAGPLSQSQVGLIIGRDQPAVSRILRRGGHLTLDQARSLDAEFGNSKPWPFEVLVERREELLRRRRPPAGRGSRVFLASPMYVAPSGYAETRRGAMDLRQALLTYCDFDVYYAGADVPTESDFDAADLAFSTNEEHLRSSSHFILLWEGLPEGSQPQKTVSSIWVEAGMALALGIPSTYFVPDLNSLPYILREASNITTPRTTAHVKVRPVASATDAVNLVRRGKLSLFTW